MLYSRRHFMGAAAGTFAGASSPRGCNLSPPAASESSRTAPSPVTSSAHPSDLKIIGVKTTFLEANWGPWLRRWLLIRVDTDQGISGYGEAALATEQVKSHVQGYEDLLIGEDPTNVEALFRKMVAGAYAGFTASHFDGGLAVHAVSGIETALWDLAGKAAGLPVYKLLGGRHRDRVRLYACVGFLDTYLEMEDVYKKLGITCLKFDITPVAIADLAGGTMDQHLTRKGLREIVALLEKIRARVGDDIEIAVEARCGTVANALRFVKAVEPFDLTWVEDPIPPTDIEGWVSLTSATPVPILTGEGLHLRHEFLDYFRRGAMNIAAPDFQVCGGLAEGKKICEMADLHHMLAAPHNAASAVGIAAAVHACAAIPNLLALEFHAMPQWERILSGFRPRIADGFIEVPEGPGLGIELDEDEIRKYMLEGETFFE